LSDKKPTLADLGLDAPVSPPNVKKSWQQIADQVDDQPVASQSKTNTKPPSDWNGIAAVMSFFMPGLGQLYKGHLPSGLALFCCTLVGYGLFIIPGIFFHIVAVFDAGNHEK